MWLPGPTRAVLLSTLVVGLLVVFAVYAALDVSRDVRVIYEAEPYHPVVHGPVDVPLLPTQPSRRLLEMDPPEEVMSVVIKHTRDRQSAFHNEMMAFTRAKNFCEETKKVFTVGDGMPRQATYSFSLFMKDRAPKGMFRRFVTVRQFYDAEYESDWKNPPTIPMPRRGDLLPPNILNQFATQQKLWRAAFTHFFTDTDGGMPLHELFNEWQTRGDAIKRAWGFNNDSLLDDLPHTPW
jgi:hypothetical protein